MNIAKMRISNAVVMHDDAAVFYFPDTDMIVYLYIPLLARGCAEVVTPN